MILNENDSSGAKFSPPTCNPPPSPGLSGAKSNNVLARALVPGGVLNLAHINVLRQQHGPQNQNHYYHHGEKRKHKQKQQKQQQQQQQQQEDDYQHDYYDASYNPFDCNDDQSRKPKPFLDDKPFNDVASDRPLPRKGKNSRAGISSTVKVRTFWMTTNVQPQLTFYQVQTKDMRGNHASHRSELSTATHNLSARMKNPKLVGADIYIARLGSIQRDIKKRNKNGSKAKPCQENGTKKTEDTCCSSISLEASSTSNGSLYDELTCKDRKSSSTQRPSSTGDDAAFDRRQLRDSRPCYRCVSYMHSAGIRRCFWTNAEGEWESAKVRDLFDQLRGTSTRDGEGGDSEGLGSIFITKHEVLLLRRIASEGK